MRRNADDGEPLSGKQGHPHLDRHDCGRDDHPRALVDEGLQPSARSRDASDQEGEPVVLAALVRTGKSRGITLDV